MLSCPSPVYSGPLHATLAVSLCQYGPNIGPSRSKSGCIQTSTYSPTRHWASSANNLATCSIRSGEPVAKVKLPNKHVLSCCSDPRLTGSWSIQHCAGCSKPELQSTDSRYIAIQPNGHLSHGNTALQHSHSTLPLRSCKARHLSYCSIEVLSKTNPGFLYAETNACKIQKER